jgi:hypothetical protein
MSRAMFAEVPLAGLRLRPLGMAAGVMSSVGRGQASQQVTAQSGRLRSSAIRPSGRGAGPVAAAQLAASRAIAADEAGDDHGTGPLANQNWGT